MPESVIICFGKHAKVCCDGNCRKAWGMNRRPRVQLSDDDDDFEWKSDQELEDAPINPGTYEGGEAKPLSLAEFPNKWCVRECERCNIGKPGEQLSAKDFTIRVRNLHSVEK